MIYQISIINLSTTKYPVICLDITDYHRHNEILPKTAYPQSLTLLPSCLQLHPLLAVEFSLSTHPVYLVLCRATQHRLWLGRDRWTVRASMSEVRGFEEKD